MTYFKSLLSALYGLLVVFLLAPVAGAISAFADAVKPHTQRLCAASYRGYVAFVALLSFLCFFLVTASALADGWKAFWREWRYQWDDLGLRFSRAYWEEQIRD